MSITNILANLSKRSYRREMIRKLKMRLLGQSVDRQGRLASLQWCRETTEDFDALGGLLDPSLLEETRVFAQRFARDAAKTLEQIGLDLGGGGFYALLYFLTRHLRPEVAVETGVAAGFSSSAILTAMQANGAGHLYSSDFPYFRLKDPERFVGVLVRKELRHAWTLHLQGDRTNLPKIVAGLRTIDFFHYDSDKSYSGREFAIRTIEPLLSRKSVLVMDDIQDNLFFRDYVSERGVPFRVLAFEGKYVGVIGI